MRNRKRLYLWIVIVILVIIIISIVNTFLFYTQFKHRFDLEAQGTAKSIAIFSAANIDAEIINAAISSGREDSQEYMKLKKHLAALLASNSDVDDVYLMIKSKNPGQLLFVAGGYSTNDVDSDGVISEDEEGVHLFESYDASDIPEIWSAFEGKVAGESIICDKWGCFLSAFAPVYDKNGNVLAIVGVDISANISGKNITLFNSSILLFSMPFLSIFIVTLIIGIVLMRHIAHVENTNEQLKMLDKMKDSLIRDVSHELKTPLVTLQMSMSLLEENLIRNPPNKEYQKIRHTVADNINRLEHIIDSILNLNAIEGNRIKYNKQMIDINKLIRKIAREVNPLAERNNLKIKLFLDKRLPYAIADESSISRVLINLLNNAIKYTTKGHVAVSTMAKNKNIQVPVRDTGIGMSTGTISKVFDRFYKKDPSTQGPGLGLTISKEIINAHNGTIFAESQGEGEGSTFVFTLPTE